MPGIAELEDKVDKISDRVNVLVERVGGLAERVGGLDKRIGDHDLDDQNRHRELREDIHAMQSNLFRLLFAGLLVIVIALGLMGALVGATISLDSSHVAIGASP